MEKIWSLRDFPLLIMLGVAIAAVAQLVGELHSIPWIAAGAIVVPVLAANGILQLGRDLSMKPVDLANESEAKFKHTQFIDVELIESTRHHTGEHEEASLPFVHEEHAEPEQSMRIWRNDAGQETVSGDLAISFSPGVRTTMAHVPWQPLLLMHPEAAVEVVDGEDVEVRVDLLRPYGMRLIARRSGDLEDPVSCRVEYYVTAKTVSKAAA